MIKKIQYIALIIVIFTLIFIYHKVKRYDANDPEVSIQRMLRLISPLERKSFIKDFYSVCDDGVRCINLHGLDREEIHDLVVRKKNNDK